MNPTLQFPQANLWDRSDVVNHLPYIIAVLLHQDALTCGIDFGVLLEDPDVMNI
jgi:hypothetical protein